METKLYQAIAARLADLSPAVPTSWPGVKFTPTTGSPWIRLSFNLVRVSALSLDNACDEFRGLAQVSVFWPPGEGLVAPMGLAETIKALFPRDSDLTYDGQALQITLPPAIGPAIIEPDWIQVPVSIYFAAFS